MPENWRPIPDYPDYEVSDHGRVRSYRRPGSDKSRSETPHPIGGTTNEAGYTMVAVGNDDGYRQLGVHRLVAWAFRGPCPEGHWVTHADGDPSNNRLENLRYALPVQNSNDTFLHAHYPDGQVDTIYWPDRVRAIALRLAQESQLGLSALVAHLVLEENERREADVVRATAFDQIRQRVIERADYLRKDLERLDNLIHDVRYNPRALTDARPEYVTGTHP